MSETDNRIETVMLLGLVPLLAATADFYTAVAATVIVVVVTLALGLWDRLLATIRAARFGYAGVLRWLILGVLAGSLSWFLGSLAVFWVPLAPGDGLVLQVVGLTPLVFPLAPAASGRDMRRRLGDVALFAVFMLGLGCVREAIGQGKLAGLLVTGYVTPFAMFRTPVGAFLSLGLMVLLGRWFVARRADRSEGHRS